MAVHDVRYPQVNVFDRTYLLLTNARENHDLHNRNQCVDAGHVDVDKPTYTSKMKFVAFGLFKHEPIEEGGDERKGSSAAIEDRKCQTIVEVRSPWNKENLFETCYESISGRLNFSWPKKVLKRPELRTKHSISWFNIPVLI